MRLLFVCNFASIHARTYIAYFAKREEFKVHVVSSFSAEPMEGVEVTELTHASMSKKSLVSTVARTIGSLHPFLYRMLTVFNRRRLTAMSLSHVENLSLDFVPDVIHAHRTQPEGIIGCNLAERYPDARFYLTTWGQDFIFWANNDNWLKTQTRRTISRLNQALPDNARDAGILKNEYGYTGPLEVMVATGGLDVDYLGQLYETCIVPDVEGDWTFLSVRGYENSTIRIRILLEALQKFRSETGCGTLYIDCHHPGDADRDRQLETWVRELDLKDAVQLLHLKREEMLAYMKTCDCYVSATRADGLPLSLLESLFFGQTPIVYDHESTRLVDSRFSNMRCFASHNAAAVCSEWLDVYRAGRLTIEEKASNQQKIRDHYSRDTNLAKIARLYLGEANGS